MSRFLDQLQRQLVFIEQSCQSFDAGHKDEAIRIATGIRVLVHDTRNSTSLLTHLNAKSIRLLSTVKCFTPGEYPAVFDGLTSFTTQGPRPKLGRTGASSLMPVPEWWDQVAYIGSGRQLTRRDLVLVAANKDGGAHVDPALTPEYEMVAGNFWTLVKPGGSAPVLNIHLLGLRQLGYEILNSPELGALLAEGEDSPAPEPPKA